MTFEAFQSANNARGQLEALIGASATSMLLKTGQGDLFPTHNGTSDKDYPLTLEERDSDNLVLKREIVLVTERVGDLLTIVRGYGYCPANETATTQTNTSFSFPADSYVFLNNTAENDQDIKTAINEINTTSLPLKLDIADYISGEKLFAESNTGNDSYEFSMPDVDSMAEIDGQVVRVRVDVENTDQATAELNSFGSYDIVKWGGAPLVTGDIKAGQVMFIARNDDEAHRELIQSVDQRTQVVATSLSDESLPPTGQAVTPGVVLFDEPMVDQFIATQSQNVGDVSGNTRAYIPGIASSTLEDEVLFLINKVGSPSVPLRLRVESDDGTGKPSGSLIHANAVLAIDETKLGTTASARYAEVTDADNLTFTSTNSSANARGYRIQAKADLLLTTVNKSSTSTARTVIVKDDAGVTIATGTFIGNVAKVGAKLVSGQYYRIECASFGASYTSHRLLSATFPQARTNIDYISGSEDGSDSTTAFNIDSIVTEEYFPKFASTVAGSDGQKVHYVLFQGTYGSETVNGANYYQIRYASRNTSTRGIGLRNGSVYGSPDPDKFAYIPKSMKTYAQLTDGHGVASGSTGAVTASYGMRMQANKDIRLIALSKFSSLTANRAIVRNDSGGILATASLSGDIATLTTPLYFKTGEYFIVEFDNTGASYNRRFSAGSYPYNRENVNFVSQTINGSVSGTDVTNVEAIYTENVIETRSSDLLYDVLLAKASALYTYKLPSIPRISKETKAIGTFPKCAIYGLNDMTSVERGVEQFLSDTEGLYSTTPGTNKYSLGKGDQDGVLFINGKNYLVTSDAPQGSPYVLQNTYGQMIQVYISGGTVSAVAVGRTIAGLVTVATATGVVVNIAPNDFLRITYSSVPTVSILYI